MESRDIVQHEIKVKVRFSETDALGHVNNVSYFIYLEEGRVDFFQKLDTWVSLRDWKFILASVKCDFIDQVYFGQDLKVSTQISQIGNKSFRLVQNIMEYETNKLVAKSESVMIYFDFDEQKSKPIPQELRDKLETAKNRN